MIQIILFSSLFTIIAIIILVERKNTSVIVNKDIHSRMTSIAQSFNWDLDIMDNSFDISLNGLELKLSMTKELNIRRISNQEWFVLEITITMPQTVPGTVEFLPKEELSSENTQNDYQGATRVGNINVVNISRLMHHNSSPPEMIHWILSPQQISIIDCRLSDLHFLRISHQYLHSKTQLSYHDLDDQVKRAVNLINEEMALARSICSESVQSVINKNLNTGGELSLHTEPGTTGALSLSDEAAQKGGLSISEE